jgi:uncharacterized protein YjbI with pentapeptide repeats
VLAEADCRGANFKLADLRGADLSGARLDGANFEGAKVSGMIFEKMVKNELKRAVLHAPLANPAAEVILTSETGAQSTARADAWLASHGVAVTPAPAGPS